MFCVHADSNDIGEEVDPEQVEYLPSHHDITECVYVRHFGPYSGNISCPDTAAALTTIQTKRVGLVTMQLATVLTIMHGHPEFKRLCYWAGL